MTASELQAALAVLHWGPVQLAAAVGVYRTTAMRWIKGNVAVPDHIGAWVSDLARYHAVHPAPAAPPPHPETERLRARRAGLYVTGSPSFGYRVASLTGAEDPPGPEYKTRREAWAAAAALASAD